MKFKKTEQKPLTFKKTGDPTLLGEAKKEAQDIYGEALEQRKSEMPDLTPKPSFIKRRGLDLAQSIGDTTKNITGGLQRASEAINVLTDPIGSIRSDLGKGREVYNPRTMQFETITKQQELQAARDIQKGFEQDIDKKMQPFRYDAPEIDTSTIGGKVKQFGESVSSGVTQTIPQLPFMLTGTPGLSALGTSAFGGKARQIQEEGGSEAQQLLGGLASAGTEVATEYLPLKRLTKLVKGKGALADVGKEMLEELVGESTSQALDPLVDWASIPDSELPTLGEYVNNVVEAGVTGAAAALLFGGSAMTINSVRNSSNKALQNPTPQNVQKALEEIQKVKPDINLQQVLQQSKIGDTGLMKPPADIQGIFDKSKAVERKDILKDDKGEEITVYHGTSQEQPFLEFDMSAEPSFERMNNIPGAWFTSTKENAKTYASTTSKLKDGKQIPLKNMIYPAKLKMKNPFIFDVSTQKAPSEYGNNLDQYIMDELKKGYYDGVIIRNRKDPTLSDQYVVFDNSQIELGEPEYSFFNYSDKKSISDQIAKKYSDYLNNNMNPREASDFADFVNSTKNDAKKAIMALKKNDILNIVSDKSPGTKAVLVDRLFEEIDNIERVQKKSENATSLIKAVPSEQTQNIFKMAENVGLQAELSQPSTVSTTVMPEQAISNGAEAVFKERGFSKNIATDLNRNEQLSREFEENPEWYEQLANKTTLEKAQARFDRGYEKALQDFDNTKKTMSPDNVVLSKLLADEAANRGDIQTARRIIADMAEVLTEAGRMSQAAKILRESNSPGAIIDYVQREINKLNEQGRKRFGEAKKQKLTGKEVGWNDIELTEQDLEIVQQMKDASPERQAELYEQLFNRIQAQIPVTLREKIDALRRMAMLMNPKTHIRNVVGNSIMGGIKVMSDKIAATGEQLIPKEQRTKAFKTDPIKKNIAKEFYEANKQDLNEGSRWEIFGVKSPFTDKRIFDNDTLEKMNKFGKDTLEAEDIIFFSRHYVNDLANFMTARGINEVTQEASDYALRRAQEATFRQNNEFANAINKLKKGRGGILVEAAMPFTKTPANIAKLGIDYSPIGLVNSAVKLFTNQSPALAIETAAKGLTGTGLALLGYYLSEIGLARGDYDKEAEGLMQQVGRLPNSITTPGGSYTIDWAQPVAIPFLMGVAFQENMSKQTDDVDYLDAVLTSLYKGGDTLINQSMLRGIKDLFSSYGSTTEKIAELPASYFSQLFPTVVGQVARTIDPVKRQRDYSTTTKELFSGIQSKTPVASKKLPVKRDIFGKQQTYGEGLTNAFMQFISPGYIGKKSTDPVVLELERLYGQVGEEAVPKYSINSFTYKGNRIELTAKEKSEAQKIMGEYTKEQLDKLINKRSYKIATDEKKAEKVKEINQKGYKMAKDYVIKQRGL